MDVIKIGERIKIARGNEYTLDDIAAKVGVAKSTIQRYENGMITNPKLPVLQSIANALGVNPAWLVCKSDEMYICSDTIETAKVRKHVSKRLDKILNSKNMSVTDLARKSGVSKSLLSQYLRGEHIPSEDSAIKMADVLGVNHLWLMGFKAPMAKESEPDADLAQVIDLYKRLNQAGKDKILERMQTLLDCGYDQQPDAYVEHAAAIEAVRRSEAERIRRESKSIG